MEASRAAISAAPTPQAREALWNEREVRRLLKAVRRPHILRSVPLASALAQAYGTDDVMQAVRRFVRETFQAGGLVGERLLELVERGDFDAEMPMTSVARAMGLSPRQFFRYRSEAVRALRLRAEALIGGFGDSKSVIARLAGIVGQTDPQAAQAIFSIAGAPLDGGIDQVDAEINAGVISAAHLPSDAGMRLLALCRIARGTEVFGAPDAARRIAAFVRDELFQRTVPQRAAIEFELHWLAYVALLYRGHVDDARYAAQALVSIARDDVALAKRAYVTLAEAAIRCGDAESARQAIVAAEQLTPVTDTRTLTVLLCCRGGIALLQHDFSLADDCYSAAEIVLGRRMLDLWNTQGIIGRARRMLGRPWVIEHAASEVQALRCEQFRLGDIPLDLPASTLRAPGRIALHIARVRSGADASSAADAETELEGLIDLAVDCGYRPDAADGYAALTEVRLRRGDLDGARKSIVAAWEAWSTAADRPSAIDMFHFAHESVRRCITGNARLFAAIAEWCRRVQPHGPFGRMSPAQARSAVGRLLERGAGASDAAPSYKDELVTGIAMFFAPRQRAGIAAAIAAEVRGEGTHCAT